MARRIDLSLTTGFQPNCGCSTRFKIKVGQPHYQLPRGSHSTEVHDVDILTNGKQSWEGQILSPKTRLFCSSPAHGIPTMNNLKRKLKKKHDKHDKFQSQIPSGKLT
jgi:hypothetical protein